MTNGEQHVHVGRYGPDVFADYVVDFMQRHRERPFLVYYPMVLPHTPWSPPPGLSHAATPLDTYAAMVLESMAAGKTPTLTWSRDERGRITNARVIVNPEPARPRLR